MDVFKFNNNPATPSLMQSGEIINGLKSKLWVERYRDSGEFKFVANVSTGMKEKLPIGTFVSHVDTAEIMMVENHEISEEPETEPEIVITGRSFEILLEERFVSGDDFVDDTGVDIGFHDYLTAYGYVKQHVTEIISHHIQAPYVSANPNNLIPYVTTTLQAGIVNVLGQDQARIPMGSDVYSAALELMALEDLGLKNIRPGYFANSGYPGSPNTVLLVHKGVDRSATVVFDQDAHQLESADYLWSIKALKNTAYVVSTWFSRFVTSPAIGGVNRRTMYVDARDIDENSAVAPTGTDRTDKFALLQARGLQALAAQKNIFFMKAAASKAVSGPRYRVDYDVGDTVTVHGSFNEVTKVRVLEYVESEDQNGSQAYPTFTPA